QFLSTDLLHYAEDPRAYEDQLLRSFSSPAFTNGLATVMQSPLLVSARTYLGGPIGEALSRVHVWPLPFLSVDDVRIEAGDDAGWFHVTLTLQLYTRVEESDVIL